MELSHYGFTKRVLICDTQNIFLIMTPVPSSVAGVLNLGEPFTDSTRSDVFNGSSLGTYLAIAAPSGFLGNLIDAQISSTSRFKVNNTLVQTQTNCQVVILNSNWNSNRSGSSLSGLSNVNFGTSGNDGGAGRGAFGAGTTNPGVTGNVYFGGSGAPGNNPLNQATVTLNAGTTNLPFLIISDVSQATNLQEFWTNSQVQVAAVDASGSLRVSLAPPTQGSNPVLSSGGSLTALTQYYWSVTAIDAFGLESGLSTERTATTTSVNKTAAVSWTARTGALSYNLYRTTATGTYTNSVKYVLGNVTTYSDDGTGGVTATPSTATAAGACLALTGSYFAQTQTNSANYGQVNLGSGPFDGSTSGFFAGSASGSIVAINTTSGFAGNILDLELAGSNKLKLDTSGNLTLAGGLSAGLVTSLSSPSAGAANILPAAPAGYATITISGVAYKVAYY